MLIVPSSRSGQGGGGLAVPQSAAPARSRACQAAPHALVSRFGRVSFARPLDVESVLVV